MTTLQNEWECYGMKPFAFVQTHYCFLRCYFFMCIMRARRIFYIHVLYFIHQDVQSYCFYHHVLRGTYLKSSRYPVHAVALLSYLMTEVPSCPLFLLSIFSEAINLQSRSHEVPLPRLWHVYSTRYCRLREVHHVLKTHIVRYISEIYLQSLIQHCCVA